MSATIRVDLPEEIKAALANAMREATFRDPLSATGADPDHSAVENRFVTFGLSSKGRLLTVSHTERGESIRIISARRATKPERKIYEEG
jgi:uncharacterized DUF497 family protein